MSFKYHLPSYGNITHEHLRQLIIKEIREDERIDYKIQPSKDISNLICAMLNTVGGQIVLGVDEKNSIPIALIGTDQNKLTKLNQNIKEKIKPSVEILIERVKIPDVDGKTFFIIHVQRNKGSWYYSSGVFYVKQGDTINPLLSGYEIEEWKKNHQENFPSKDYSFKENYKQKLANRFSRIFFHSFPIEISTQTTPKKITDVFVPVSLVLNRDYEYVHCQDDILKLIKKQLPFIENDSFKSIHQLSREIYNLDNIDIQLRLIGFLLKHFKKLVVLGVPGSGKSTLLNFLCFYFSKTKSKDILGYEGELTPFYIEAKEFARFVDIRKKKGNSYSLIDYLVYLLENNYQIHLEPSVLKQQIEEILHSNSALILIDAVDEVVKISKQKVIMSLIQSFSVEFKKVRLIISSRILGYNSYALPDNEYVHSRIMPLRLPIINHFIKNWFEKIEQDKELSKRKIDYLIRKIHESVSLYQLSSNPLILTLLCLTLKLGTTVPSQQYELYTNLSKTLYVTREEVKELSTVIPFRYLEQILSEVAFSILTGVKKSKVPFRISQQMFLQIITQFYQREYSIEELEALEKAKNLQDELITRPIVLIPQGDHFFFWHQSFLDYYATLYMRKLYLSDKTKFGSILEKNISNIVWWEVFHLTIEALDELSRKTANDYSENLFKLLENLKPPPVHILQRIAQKENVNNKIKEKCKRVIITTLKDPLDNIWAPALIELLYLIQDLSEQQEEEILQIIFLDIMKFQKVFQFQSKHIVPLYDFLNNLYTKDKDKFIDNLRKSLVKVNLGTESVLIAKYIEKEINVDIIESILRLHFLPIQNFVRFHCFRKFIRKPEKNIDDMQKKEKIIIEKLLKELEISNFCEISIKQFELTVLFLNRFLGYSNPIPEFVRGFVNNLISGSSIGADNLKLWSSSSILMGLAFISDTLFDFYNSCNYERVDLKINYFQKNKPASYLTSVLKPITLIPGMDELSYNYVMDEGYYFDHPFSFRFRIKLNSYKSGIALKYIFENEDDLSKWIEKYRIIKQYASFFKVEFIENEEISLIERAKDLFNKTEYDEVEKLAVRIIDMDPSFDPAYRFRALAMGGLNQFEESIDACNEYTKLFGKHRDIEIQKASNLVHLFEDEDALILIGVIEKEYDLEGQSRIFLLEKKAIALYRTDEKKVSEAIKIFNEIIKEKPKRYLSYYHKAGALIRIKKYQECLKFLDRKKSDIKEEYPQILISRMLCYINLNRIEEAIDIYLELKELNLHQGLIIVPDEGETQRVLFHTKLLERDPEEENALISEAIIIKKANINEAYSIINKVVSKNPENPFAWLQKAEIELEIGNQEEALKSLQKVLKIDKFVLRNIEGNEDLQKLADEITNRSTS